MTLGEALELVHELAKENALSKAEARENDLCSEYDRQQEALDMVEDFIVNEFGKEDEE